MIQKESLLKVVDNAGLVTVKCIHIYLKNRIGSIGDWVLVSARKRLPSKKLMLNSKTFLALVVALKKNIKRQNGHYIKFSYNGVVTFFTKDNFKGTSITKPLSVESKKKKNTDNFLMVAHPRKFY